MRNRTKLTSLLAFLIGLLVLCFVLFRKDSIIINNGYAHWRTANIIAIVFTIVTGIWCATINAISIIQKIRQKQSNAAANAANAAREAEAEERRKLRNPEDVRQYFLKLRSTSACTEGSDLHQVTRTIVEQLNQMNGYQERLKELLELNDIGAMKSAEPILQEVENGICTRCKSAINQYVASADQGPFVSECQKAIGANQASLDKVEGFLRTLAEYANGRQRDDADAEASLEIYCDQLRRALNEEGF